jgi:hypothetical protein
LFDHLANFTNNTNNRGDRTKIDDENTLDDEKKLDSDV